MEKVLKYLAGFRDRLPPAVRLLIIYTLGYFGVHEDFLKLVGHVLPLSASAHAAFRWSYLATCGVHFALVTLREWGQRRGWQVPAWLHGKAWPLTFACAAGIITAVTLIASRGETRRVADKALRQSATEAIDALEGKLEHALTPAKAAATKALDYLVSGVAGGARDATALGAALTDFGRRQDESEDRSSTDLIIVRIGQEAPRLVHPSLETPPSYVAEILGRLPSHRADETVTAVQWTPVGYLVVAARQLPLATIAVAQLWGEGEFLKATESLWGDSAPSSAPSTHEASAPTGGWGLFLLTESNQITYSTEVAEDGRRLARTPAPALKPDTLTEISTIDGPRYLYQHASTRLPGVFLRVQLPPQVRPSQLPTLAATLCLILFVVFVAVYIYKEDEARPTPPSPGPATGSGSPPGHTPPGSATPGPAAPPDEIGSYLVTARVGEVPSALPRSGLGRWRPVLG